MSYERKVPPSPTGLDPDPLHVVSPGSLGRARDDPDAAPAKKNTNDGRNLCPGASTPCDDRVECADQFPLALCTRRNDPDVLEAKFSDRRRKKRGPPSPRLDEDHVNVRPNDLEWNAGNACARPEVCHVDRLARHELEKQQAVEDQVLEDPGRIVRARQSMNPVPLADQLDIRAEPGDLLIGQLAPKDLRRLTSK